MFSKPRQQGHQDNQVDVHHLNMKDIFTPDPVHTVTILLKREAVRTQAERVVREWVLRRNLPADGCPA